MADYGAYMPAYPNVVEELRETYPDLIEAAEEVGDLPDLFPGGIMNLPLETASGIERDSLEDLDWRAKLIVAQVVDRPAAVELLNRFSADDGALYARERFGTTSVVADALNDTWAAVQRLTRGRPEWTDMVYEEGLRADGSRPVMASADEDLGAYGALFGAGSTAAPVAASSGGGDPYVELYGRSRQVTASGVTEEDYYRTLFGIPRAVVASEDYERHPEYAAIYGGV